MFVWLHDLLHLRDPHHAMLRVVETSLVETPHEWKRCSHTVENEKRSLCIWTANGAFGLDLYDGIHWNASPEIHLPLGWKRRLWKATKGGRSDHRAQLIVDRFKERGEVASNVVRLHGTNP